MQDFGIVPFVESLTDLLTDQSAARTENGESFADVLEQVVETILDEEEQDASILDEVPVLDQAQQNLLATLTLTEKTPAPNKETGVVGSEGNNSEDVPAPNPTQGLFQDPVDHIQDLMIADDIDSQPITEGRGNGKGEGNNSEDVSAPNPTQGLFQDPVDHIQDLMIADDIDSQPITEGRENGKGEGNEEAYEAELLNEEITSYEEKALRDDVYQKSNPVIEIPVVFDPPEQIRTEDSITGPESSKTPQERSWKVGAPEISNAAVEIVKDENLLTLRKQPGASKQSVSEPTRSSVLKAESAEVMGQVDTQSVTSEETTTAQSWVKTKEGAAKVLEENQFPYKFTIEEGKLQTSLEEALAGLSREERNLEKVKEILSIPRERDGSTKLGEHFEEPDFLEDINILSSVEAVSRKKAGAAESVPRSAEFHEPARSAEAQRPEFVRQIARQLKTFSLFKESSLRMRLHPEELGRVEIQLVKNAEGGMSVSFTADLPETGQLLESHLTDLKQSLDSVGVTVDELVVDHDGAQNPSSNAFGQRARQPGRKTQERKGAARTEKHQLTSITVDSSTDSEIDTWI